MFGASASQRKEMPCLAMLCSCENSLLIWGETDELNSLLNQILVGIWLGGTNICAGIRFLKLEFRSLHPSLVKKPLFGDVTFNFCQTSPLEPKFRLSGTMDPKENFTLIVRERRIEK